MKHDYLIVFHPYAGSDVEAEITMPVKDGEDVEEKFGREHPLWGFVRATQKMTPGSAE